MVFLVCLFYDFGCLWCCLFFGSAKVFLFVVWFGGFVLFVVLFEFFVVIFRWLVAVFFGYFVFCVLL